MKPAKAGQPYSAAINHVIVGQVLHSPALNEGHGLVNPPYLELLEEEVISRIDLVENRVAALVRATYARASNAAHTFEGRKEVLRILKYFEAFVHDLLDIDES